MKKIICFLTFIYCSFIGFGQPVNIDSLLAIFKDESKHDTVRLVAIRDASMVNLYSDPVASIDLALQMKDFAEVKENELFKAHAALNLGTGFTLTGEYEKSLQQINEAIGIYKAHNKQAMLATAYKSIGITYLYSGELDNSLEYYEKSASLAKEIGEKNTLAAAIINTGEVYYMKGDNKTALKYYENGAVICDEIGNKRFKANAMTNAAAIYETLGDPKRAIRIYLENLPIHEELGNVPSVINSYINISSVYNGMGDHEKSIEYTKKAIAISEETGNKRSLATALGNLAVSLISLKKFDESIEYSNRSINISKEIGNHYHHAVSLINLGDAYREIGQYDKALDYLQQGLEITEELDVPDYIAYALLMIGDVELSKKNINKAIANGQRSLGLSKEMDDVVGVKMASLLLYEAYKASGNISSALNMYELHNEMKDSLVNEENQRAIIKQQYEYEYEKQKSIDDLENEKLVAIEKEKQKRQKTLSLVVGFGLLLTLILAGIIFNRLKITRQQKAIIEEQKKKVEQSEKYKEQFLANMSHEIRTPMHAISGMVKILKRNEHPSSQDAFLDAMQTSSDNLLVILNDVLDMSKIEAGKLDVDKVPMEPAAVVNNVVSILNYKATEKGILLNAKIADNVPSLIMSDPARLNQVLINLAGNAIKFTDKGSVEISVAAQNGQLKFAIKDTGIGIPEEKLETIFGSFEQVKNRHQKNIGGTGLGLSISKQLVELMGGKILVESKQGEGSLFHFSIPLVLAKVGAVSTDLLTDESLRQMASSLKGIKILLAEDNEFNQMIAQDDLFFYLEEVTIDVVENGVAAVEKFKTNNYDVILMDVQMPELDGFEAAKAIRELELKQGVERAIPIIAMTASLLKSEIENCYASGMDNYVPKPYKVAELIMPIYNEVKS